MGSTWANVGNLLSRKSQVAAGIAWGCLSVAQAVAAPPLTAEPVVIQGAPTGHLHVDRHVTNAEYRQQVLALTPLGSTHEQVKACVLEEWRFGKQPINQYMVGGDLGLTDQLPFGDPRLDRDLVREKPPHAPLDLQRPFLKHKGWRFMHTTFSRDKVFGRPQANLGVTYVFDKHDRLIDVFTVGHGPSRPFW